MQADFQVLSKDPLFIVHEPVNDLILSSCQLI